MKKSNIGVAVLVIILTVIAYLFGQYTSKEDGKKAENQTQIASCAKQSQLVLENEQKKADANTSYSQRNHYNNSLSKCLVEINYTLTDAEGVFFSDEIRDAYEQKTFIACLSGSLIKNPYCFIPGNNTISGQAVNMTTEEGADKIRAYMMN